MERVVVRSRSKGLLPGTQGQPHEVIADAGHFLQEDKGPEIAAKMVAWLENDA